MGCNSNSVIWVWSNWNGNNAIKYLFFYCWNFFMVVTGYLWRDKAIMVVHVGALISILSGLFFSSN
jgi:hypothetical protein